MFADTPLVMVEDTAKLEEVVADLDPCEAIGIDTESDSFHHYQEKVCLIQLSDMERDFIVDPLKIDDLSSLGRLLGRRDQVKILHGADYDVVCLKRDYGFEIHNIFDTMIAAQFLGMPRIGLADLIGRYFGHTVDKKYQRHDWSERPLLPEHVQYARGDTHFLLALRDVLSHKLHQRERWDAAHEEFRLLEEREWSGRTRHPADFLRVRQALSLDLQGRRVLRAVWEYRDARAREQDRPGFRVMPDPVLVQVAAHRPQTTDDLARLVRRGSTLLRRHGDAILAAVKVGLADTEPLPELPKSASPAHDRRHSGGPSIDRLLGPLKAWRNEVVQTSNLNPVVVASNQLLKEIARLAPTTVEELAVVPGIRRWQVRDFGEQITRVVADAGAPPARKKKRRSIRRAVEG